MSHVRMRDYDNDQVIHLGDGLDTLCGVLGYQDYIGRVPGQQQRLCEDCARWEMHESLRGDDDEDDFLDPWLG